MGEGQMKQLDRVADSVGLSKRTVRHYEHLGVVVPTGRSTSGQRLYTQGDIDQLRLVKRMRPLDFSVEEQREVLTLLDQLVNPSDPVDTGAAGRLAGYAARSAERSARLRSQLTDGLVGHRVLSAESCARLRSQLAGALEFTDIVGRAVSGPQRPNGQER